MTKRIIFGSLALLLITAGVAIYRVKTNEAPEKELNLARKMLSEAQLVKAPRYAKEPYTKATQYYREAMDEWSKENNRPILFRNYSKVGQRADQSAKFSQEAINMARKNISKVEDLLEIQISKLEIRMREFDENMGRFPIKSGHKNEITKSKLQFSEGVLAYKNKNYPLCKTKLDSVETTLNRVFVIYEKDFQDYLMGHPQWMEKVEQTIHLSKKNKSYAIIVDKLARSCKLYKDGKEIKIFSVELGANWIGPKNQRGDKSTPEGLYKVIDKKRNPQTRYHKALLLNYPNDEDKKRFLQNKREGVLKPNASIGNLIEIHGDGGKGIDWTDGCIALKNADMDVLFDLCPMGTKVTIVGSTKPLTELSINPK